MSQAQTQTLPQILDTALLQMRYAKSLTEAAYDEQDEDLRLCVLNEAMQTIDRAMADLRAAGAH